MKSLKNAMGLNNAWRLKDKISKAKKWYALALIVYKLLLKIRNTAIYYLIKYSLFPPHHQQLNCITYMKNLLVSLSLYGLALVLYSHLINENYDNSGNSSYPAASWNYKEKLAGYTGRERPHRQASLSDDNNRDLYR